MGGFHTEFLAFQSPVHSVESFLRTVRSFKGQASHSEELLQHLTSRGLGLLEQLDQFAQHYPAEILQMPFQLLYSASLSPAGTCQQDKSPRLIPPPEVRWFRAKVDGTRYYSPWPSSIDLLFRWAAEGGRPSNWARCSAHVCDICKTVSAS